MNKLSKYFLKLIQDHFTFSFIPVMCIKNFKIDKFGKIYWDENDKPPANARCVSILGLLPNCYGIYNYFNLSHESSPSRRSHPFQHSWTKWGSFEFDVNELKSEPICSFLENVFLQILHEVDNGQNVFIGNTLFIKKNTAYEHLANADLLDVE